MRSQPDSLWRKLSLPVALGMVALWASHPVVAARLEGAAKQPNAPPDHALFLLGRPDASALEFGCARSRWPAFATTFPRPILFTVGADPLTAWPYIHPSTLDSWAGANKQTFTIRFNVSHLLALAGRHPLPVRCRGAQHPPAFQQ